MDFCVDPDTPTDTPWTVMTGTGGATGDATIGAELGLVPLAEVTLEIKALEALTEAVCTALRLTGDITECVATRVGMPAAFRLPTGNWCPFQTVNARSIRFSRSSIRGTAFWLDFEKPVRARRLEVPDEPCFSSGLPTFGLQIPGAVPNKASLALA
jgi:hypothetical protein